MNAIDLLRRHHVTALEALEEMSRGSVIDPMELRLVADELVAHMVIEEHVFYPRVREVAKTKIDEAFEEHIVTRFELARALSSSGAEQKARLEVLKHLVNQHVRDEENDLFPKVLRAVRREELDALGDRMSSMFERAVEIGFDRLVVPGHDWLGLPKAAVRHRPRIRVAPSRSTRPATRAPPR